jgi:serine/threonine protein kinase
VAQKYGKWSIKKSLGEGGQSFTFLVEEEGVEEKGLFVLKRIKNPKRIERAKKEISAYEKLSHPNVVKLIDYNLDSSPPYLVTEYCEGGDLSQLDLNQLSIIERLRLFLAICQGVAHAHKNSVIHRDLKPANIFLHADKRTPVIGDFGICFVDDDGARHTLIDEAVGPRNFIAPELENGRAELIAPTADVYSLGKLLYWLVAGRIFSREEHRAPEFDLTKENNDAAIMFIYELLDKTIKYEPSQRLASASEVTTEVDLIIRRYLMHAHPINIEAPQLCTYCGIGNYKVMANPENPQFWSQQISFFSQSMSHDPWLVFLCDHCGNVQLFRPDKNLAENRNVWIKK